MLKNNCDLAFKNISYCLLLFLTIFGTKLHGKLDLPVLAGLIFLALGLLRKRAFYPLALAPYIIFFWIISIYSLLISIFYGGNEIIFPLKFIRTGILFFLIYYAWLEIKSSISYDEFCKYFVIMTAIHSTIIISAIVFPDFRHVLYDITGYTPRGPEWSRSPGLTISFNATAIVHIIGLWLLASRREWSGWIRICLGLLILVSLIFLGRTISFLGLFLIILFTIFRLKPIRIIMIGIGIPLTLIMIFQLSSIEYSPTTTEGKVVANFRHFIEPLTSHDEKTSIKRYYSENLSSHIYFSDRWEVILFGNSYAGHAGIITPHDEGETNSDLGIINSINANGMLVTAGIYIFYFCLFWQCRNKDWQTVTITILLTIALSFKETGIFTSHATSLLFYLFFYQTLDNKNLQYKKSTTG